ncbi:hypothetical protein EKI60_06270 [Candidatus Saccharibacteria bacterium]|nr:MAG: hypothetical protein EKI60_06270 [Candidatus Saccharibacteria bacterium]
MSYEAIVVVLSDVRPHPNADRLKLAVCQGHQVVVGLNVVEGMTGIFFPEDGKLSVEYCETNGLYPIYDASGAKVGGGFFDPKNSRVRAQAFRGEKSYGYFAPIESVAYTGVDISTLIPGVKFSELNGHNICEKYYTKATLSAMNSGNKLRRSNAMFHKHVDTLRFKYEADSTLKVGGVAYITEKLHGTSARVGLVLETVNLPDPWFYRFKRKKARTSRTKSNWTFTVGTRNLILTDPLTQGYYNDESFRFRSVESLRSKLHKGEIIYSELVGFVSDGRPIMSDQDTSTLKDLKQTFGDVMRYTYGTNVDECKQFVYRITNVNVDGVEYELSWQQVKQRCKELDLVPVPDLCYPILVETTEDVEVVKQTVLDLTSGPSTLDQRHIREGVVVRFEDFNGKTSFLKNKSWEFGVLEGYLKNNEEYVDLEETS